MPDKISLIEIVDGLEMQGDECSAYAELERIAIRWLEANDFEWTPDRSTTVE